MTINTPVLILGMHRSGTSCLAGSLQDAGLHLGKVNTQAGFNQKGNRENHGAMLLHEKVLERIGCAWNNPPSFDPIWTDGEIQALTVILKSFPKNCLWGLKDPRALFMMNGWMPLTRPLFIGTFRSPSEVAASLMHRAKIWKQPMSQRRAFKLWEVYNSRLLAFYNAQPFDIIRYDVDADTYHKNLISAGEKLGLEVPSSPKFRVSALHNQRLNNASIPAALQSLWEELNDIAL